MNIMNFFVKKILLPAIFMFLLFMGCNRIYDILWDSDNKYDNDKGEGLCIYPTKVEYTSDLSYQNFDIESAPIIDNPIISYDNIISYDTTSHILNLIYSRDSLKSRIGKIGVYGEAFLVTLDASKIYGGWFWTPISSIPCHWVVIEPDDLFDSLATNEIRIKLGYPAEDHFKGEDPRNNPEIMNRLVIDGKAK
jgi:hypothetical protein